MVAIVRAHSTNWAATGDAFHDWNGKDFSQRYIDAGYTCSITRAENVANFPRSWSSTEELLDKAINDGFMNSAGHKANILGPHVNIGVGVYIDSNGRVGVTQNFC